MENSEQAKSNASFEEKNSVSVSGNIKIVRELHCPVGSTAVAYTDDLNLVAVGQENGSVHLYEQGTLNQQLSDCEIMREMEPCTDIKVRSSPKNGFHKSILVTYLGGQVKLWDTKIGKCLFTMKEERQIYGANYHHFNSKFLTYGNDFKVNLYDEERRVTERILACSEIFGSTNGHTDSVCCAKFHPRNPFEVVSSGLDGTIQFWDLRVPHAVRCIFDVFNFGEAIDISGDGKTLLVGVSNSKNCTLRVYDYGTGARINENEFADSYIYCCKFLTSAHVGIGCFFRNAFRIVNLRTGEAFGSACDLPGCVMSFSPKRMSPQQRIRYGEVPGTVVCSAEKVYEMEPMPCESEESEE